MHIRHALVRLSRPMPIATRLIIGLIVMATGSRALYADPLQHADPPEGFTALFNGEDLTGWWGLSTEDPRAWKSLPPDELASKRDASIIDINTHWRIEDGVLVNDGSGLYLSTDKDYGDFELLLDYKTVANADSGIYLRGVPQIQIWDTTEAGGKWNIGADKGSGGLWNNAKDAPGKDPLVLADKPFGQWNHFRIIMVGERVTVYLNDTLIVDDARLANYFDRATPILARGPIELQTHGGEIRWRNIYIREIEPSEANAMLAERNDDGFESIFNGRDLAGWSGPTDNYEVRDNTIVCKPGKGGTIYTEAEYEDFIVRLEIKIPSGGNNGLALRYPGGGDTAYVGMCELQILDNTHEKFATLNAKQYHGSAYGQVAAHRGYLRETGQWNFQQVTVKGSRITVQLNGTTILDADLAENTDFMYEVDLFKGRLRTKGHFGFAGHNDPVQFRNIHVKVLETVREQSGDGDDTQGKTPDGGG